VILDFRYSRARWPLTPARAASPPDPYLHDRVSPRSVSFSLLLPKLKAKQTNKQHHWSTAQYGDGSGGDRDDRDLASCASMRLTSRPSFGVTVARMSAMLALLARSLNLMTLMVIL
jgi:hypothetical protein